MRIYDIFKRGIEAGIHADLRPREEVLGYYWKETISCGPDSFVNPYADSGVVHAPDLAKDVRVVAIGIDIGQDEVLTIEEWEEKTGKTVDLFLSHHPRGKPAVTFPHILKTQIGNLAACGVEVTSLERLFDAQVKESSFEILSSNFIRTYGTVELLNDNYISIHSPLDNMTIRFLERIIVGNRAETLGDVISLLRTVPEYRLVEERFSLRPEILVGKKEAKIGKLLLTEFTGGEEGPEAVYKAMKDSGVHTLLVMHISSEGEQMARKLKLNVITAGHMASDSIGMNLFSDDLERDNVEVIPIGGFVRVQRRYS